ncbi:MAG TPA: hypothetical protein VHD56_06885 [Tepidisphaeraceae bacterium]|nr:hypothetical protein [Tepidisphaeraceae bacterium]
MTSRSILSSLLVLMLAGWVLAQSPDVTTNTYKEQVVVERTTTTRETQTTTHVVKANYKCAIFVANRADRVDDSKVLAMQDLLTGYATDNHFTIVAREDVLNAVANLADAGPNQGNSNLAGAKLDQLLSNNSSALRLAQNLNCDYVLMVTITSFGTDRQNFRDNRTGVDLALSKSQMRATYRLLDGTTGGAVTAGVATASVEDRVDSRSSITRQNVIDDLIDATAMDMAKMLDRAARAGSITAPVAPGEDVNFQVNCNIADLSIPDVIKNDRGERILGPGRYRLDAQAVAVEVDGMVVGTSPGPFKIKPGMHKLRLRRDLLSDWEGTVNIANGTTLDIAMKFNDQGYSRFKDLTAFTEHLKQGSALTEADINAINGYAKMLEQSHIRWDVNQYVHNDVRGDVDMHSSGPGGPGMPAAPQPSTPRP